MIRFGRVLPRIRRIRSACNRTQLITTLLTILFIIGIHKTFVRYKSNHISELTSTIISAAESASYLDNVDTSVNHLWQKNCGGNLNFINNRVLLLRNGIISGHFIDAKQTGGGDVEKVIGQSEEDEFVTVKKGFIRIPCDEVVLPNLGIESAYGHLINAIDVAIPNNYVGNTEKKPSYSFVIVIERKDYANVYWTMIELYNAFLSARMFSRNPTQTCVLLLDVHPKGKLDEIWNMVFGTVLRVKEIKESEWNFRNLVFGIDTYSGPITTEMESLPFISEFQEAIYQANTLHPPTKTACSLNNQYINITLILRHNYVAHARNPTGKIKRKLANEGEIISYIKSVMPFAKLTAVQLEDLTIENQVELIYYTDILLGVHGAGLGHVILMRPESGLIELFPTSYFLFRNRHFENLARWVGVHYTSWYNFDMFLADSELMYVSPSTVVRLVQEMVTKICSSISNT